MSKVSSSIEHRCGERFTACEVGLFERQRWAFEEERLLRRVGNEREKPSSSTEFTP